MTGKRKYFGKAVGLFIMLVALYFLTAAAGSLIPVNPARDDPRAEIKIYLRTNGVHTSLILPIANEHMDWTEIVDFDHTLSKREDFRYVSFGWGDLVFYKNVPQWSDLSPSVAFKALFKQTPSALNVEFYDNIIEGEDTFSIAVTHRQYQQMVDFIRDSFKYDEDGNAQLVPEVHYNRKDAFYRAERHMNLFYTCNSWTNEALKASDLRACLWTPLDKGIFYQYR